MPAHQLGAEPDDIETAIWAVLSGKTVEDAAPIAGLHPHELTEAVTTYRQGGRYALHQAGADSWQHFYIKFADWNQAQDVFTESVLPVLQQLHTTDQLQSWWFLRKHPCWRLRLQTASDTVPQDLLDMLDRAVRHGHLTGWWTGIYESETAAFGGHETMHTIHKLFTADSIHTLTVMPKIHGFGKRELSILLISAMARAAGLEWYERGDLWDRVAAERPLPDGPPRELLTQMSKELLPLLHVDVSPTSALLAPYAPLHAATDWLGAFRTAGHQLGTAARNGTATRGLREVLSYVVIFHWNRLGLTTAAQAALATAARAAVFDTYSYA